MTSFDLVVIGIIALSTLLALLSGFIRLVVSLAAWIVAALAAIRWSEPVGTMLPEFGASPGERYAVAFALIVVVVLIAGALAGWLLSRLARAIGLGPIDRLLGAVFGLARGVLIVVLLVLLAGLTDLPREDWWQNASLAPPLVEVALSLRPWLPEAWAKRLDYGSFGRSAPKATSGTGV